MAKTKEPKDPDAPKKDRKTPHRLTLSERIERENKSIAFYARKMDAARARKKKLIEEVEFRANEALKQVQDARAADDAPTSDATA